MFTLTVFVHVVIAIVIIIAVLLQVGKGATMGSSFGGSSSQTVFGSSGPASLLLKITIACGIIFMLTSLYLTSQASKRKSASIMKDVPVSAPAAAPVVPALPATPAQK